MSPPAPPISTVPVPVPAAASPSPPSGPTLLGTTTPAQWDAHYRGQNTPWDRGTPSLALHDLVAQRPDLVPPAQEHDTRGHPLRSTTGAVRKRTALVPGCGRGHDVLMLSAWGYDVWGLDVSDTARQQAEDNQRQADEKGLYKAMGTLEKGDVHWVTADFFSPEWNRSADIPDSFDLIFDYTFLCALPPPDRPRWSKRTVELLSHGGRLVCLEFPTTKPMSEPGPPWGLSPELYEALLAAPGDDIPYNSDGTVQEAPSPKPNVEGLHRISLIKPLRTHPMGVGENGAILDFISVWTQ